MCEADETPDGMIQDLDTAYLWLNQLRDDLIEACHEAEVEFGEEIDRNNLRTMMANIEAVELVRDLMEETEDPRAAS